jgi:hypothetical protein
MPGRPMMRASGAVALGSLAIALAASCSSSGTDTQSFSPSSPASDHSTSTSDSPPSSPTHPSTSRSSTRVSAVPTPTVTTPAQSAVDSAIAVYNAYNAASMDPSHADLAKINTYLTGKAVALYDNSIKGMRANGTAYRGTPANPRLRVVGSGSGATVLLASCPLESSTDPFGQYYIATGKPVPVKKLTPPPPYRQLITVVKTAGGWKVSSFQVNTGQTCTA